MGKHEAEHPEFHHKNLSLGLKRRPLISSWIGRLALNVSAPGRL
jgi:hypothetical protein